MSTQPVPPGWHADPQNVSRERFWNGSEWTEETRVAQYVPFKLAATRGSSLEVAEPDTATPFAWWLAFSPLWFSIGCFALFGVTSLSPLASLALNAYVVSSAVTLLGLAFVDRDSLKRQGVRSAASPFWMLLTPVVYLGVRWFASRRDGGRGGALPFLVLIALLIAVLAFATFWIGLLGFTQTA